MFLCQSTRFLPENTKTDNRKFRITRKNFTPCGRIYTLSTKVMSGKQKGLSLQTKVNILKAVEKSSGEHGAKGRIAKEFGIANSTLSNIIKDKQKIFDTFERSEFELDRKRLRTAAFKDVEDALLLWFKGVHGKNVPVSGPILQVKAEELAKELGYTGFQCGSGWLQRFKNRHGICQKRICGESAAVDEQTTETWLSTTLLTLLEDFEPQDVFNADKTGLFFKMLPEKILEFKGTPCHGGKYSKERITVLVGANADGTEKLPLLVIGKSKQPRCFKNVRSLPTAYDFSSKAWMTGGIFSNRGFVSLTISFGDRIDPFC